MWPLQLTRPFDFRRSWPRTTSIANVLLQSVSHRTSSRDTSFLPSDFFRPSCHSGTNETPTRLEMATPSNVTCLSPGRRPTRGRCEEQQHRPCCECRERLET